MTNPTSRRLPVATIVLAFVISGGVPVPGLSSVLCPNTAQGAVGLLSGSSVAKAILKYFGKEGAEEATEYLARQGGREVAERVGKAALREGGEEAAEKVTQLATKYGPDALKALDNAPAIGPVLNALDEIPESQVRTAIARLSAGKAGRELAETIGRVGTGALRSELKHPGIGGMLARTLGDDGVELASTLTKDQAIAVARHADDIAALPAKQRSGVLSLMHNDAERIVGFLGKFAADNPGMTLFTVATTTVLLAESERILGGEEIVFDAEGNPILISKAGLAGRTLEAGGKVVAEVSNEYIRPLYLTVLAFVGTFGALWMLMKLYHLNRRERLATATMGVEPPTVEGRATKKDG